MTTPNVNAPVMMPAGAQEITSGKAKGDREDQSFMDVLSIADSAAKTKAPEQKGQIKDTKDQTKAPKEMDKVKQADDGRPKDVKKDSDNKDSKAVDESTKTDKADKSQKAENADKAKTDEGITEAAKDVKAAVEEKLGIPDEELTQVMETLGLTMVDLLDPKTMVDIVAEVKDVTPVDMVADEELTGIVKDLQSTVREKTADLIQEMDVTPEEFKQTLADYKTEYEVVSPGTEKEEKFTDPREVKDDTMLKDQERPTRDDTVRTPAEAVKTTTVEAHQDRTERMPDEKEGESKVSLDINVNGRSDEAQNNMSQSSETPQDDLFRSEGRTRTTGNAESHTNHNNNIFIQNLTNAVENTLEAAAQTQSPMPHSTMVDAMDLIEQINSQIRAVIDNETQSLAMQLHPESLGRMNVELVSRGGQITAQFEAENASVRAALEGHIAELRQSLEQRGLKVENVEVTVATHEFEQNLMGGEQSGNAASEQSGRGRRSRNINLNDLDPEDIAAEEMDEGERIAREMMAADGNSVDFTA